jgi:hypothetical protein
MDDEGMIWEDEEVLGWLMVRSSFREVFWLYNCSSSFSMVSCLPLALLMW